MESPSEAKKDLKSTYDTIADVWVHLKSRPLLEVVEFSKSATGKGPVLDIGSSNCRNLVPFIEKKFRCIALDFSRGMIRKAKEFLSKKGMAAHCVIADISALPFGEKSFEYVICTRVLHHIPMRSVRASAISEVRRVTRSKGEILVSVYRRYFPRFLLDIFYNLGEKKFEFGDTYKRWEYHGRIYKRFYHLFTLEEIADELRKSNLKVRALSKGKEVIIAKCIAP